MMTGPTALHPRGRRPDARGSGSIVPGGDVTQRPGRRSTHEVKRPAARSDVELLAAAPADAAAFGEFYARHERDVLRFFLHWTRSPELAADLMAETFAEAFQSLGTYRPERGEPRPWVFGIARNLLGRSLRRGQVEDATRRRLGMAPLVVDDEAAELIEALGPGDTPALDALGELSGLLREAVAGRIVDEREYRELAASLRCSESVVRQRVRRGLARMRERLEVAE
jgi:RNA polymerase sigma factor (sigma-70 family)